MKDLYEFDDMIRELNDLQDGKPLEPLRKASARRLYMAQAERIAKKKSRASSVARKGFPLFTNSRFVLRAALVLLLAFSSLFAGTVYAAEASLPGDLMYSVNLKIEETHLGLVTNPERAIGLSLSFSDERLSEIRQLVSIGRYEYIPSTLDLYRKIITGPVLAKAKHDPALAASSVRIIETLTEQEQELRSLRADVVGGSQGYFDQVLAVLDVERQQHVTALNVSGYDEWPPQTDEETAPGDSGQDESMPAELWPDEVLENPGQDDYFTWLDEDDLPGESNPGQGNSTPPGLTNPGHGNPTPPGLTNPGQGNPTPPGQDKNKVKDKDKGK
jgi:hypothetical protein